MGPHARAVHHVHLRPIPLFGPRCEPSALSVALALSHAVLPKDDYLRNRGPDVPWPAGRRQRLHLDNAKEFHSEALRRGIAQYGIDLQHRRLASQHRGGHIERLIGTTIKALRLLPGGTGRGLAERPGDPEATAAMTLDELGTRLVHQIAGVYRHSVHRGLGRASIPAWTEATARMEAPHRHPRAYLAAGDDLNARHTICGSISASGLS